jgi:hypothetical protein
VVEISLINQTNSLITSWGFTRPNLKEFTKWEVIKVVSYLAALVFFGKKTLDYFCS